MVKFTLIFERDQGEILSWTKFLHGWNFFYKFETLYYRLLTTDY